MKKIFGVLNFFVGASTLLVIGLVYSFLDHWGFYDLAQIFVLSIICTAGIALIVWIPGLCLLGYLVSKLVAGITGHTLGDIWGNLSGQNNAKNNTKNTEKITTYTANDLAIFSYITQCREQGFTDNVIRFNLKNAGWLDAEINKHLPPAKLKS